MSLPVVLQEICYSIPPKNTLDLHANHNPFIIVPFQWVSLVVSGNARAWPGDNRTLHSPLSTAVYG
jgi:hypothetical protein